MKTSVFLTICFVALSSSAAAHDIPNDATVLAFLKPVGQHLYFVVRAPLQVMRDVDFPERRDGYLDAGKLQPLLPGAATVWIANFVDLYEGETRLTNPQIAATMISLASDKSFESYDKALAHINGPKLDGDVTAMWNQVFVDVVLDYRIRSDQSYFSIRPGFERLAGRVVTVLKFLPPSGVTRAYEFTDDPGLIRLDPRWYQAAARFVSLGFHHILDGIDHLLFLACLVIPFRRFRALVPVVTAFTLAHSITLVASAYNFAPSSLAFPPLIETLIAFSIFYMALENIVGKNTTRRRWLFAFGFGLIHGFGFSFALRSTLQFAGSHLLSSLLCFNIGVELGQLLVLLLLIPALDLLFRFVVAERMGTIILSTLIAHTGWHWMSERANLLRRFQFEWPRLDAAAIAWALQALIVVWIVVGFIWIGLVWKKRRATRIAQHEAGANAHPRSAVPQTELRSVQLQCEGEKFV